MSINSSVVTKATTNPLASLCRTDAVIVLVLFALVIGVWIPRFSGPIDLRWDGSVYYILGTSLAEGKGYRLLNEPGEIEAVQYPPLLPIIVAAHQWILGTSDPFIVGRWLRLSFFLIFAAYILAIYLMLRNFFPLHYAFVGTLVCLFSVQTYFMSDLLFPEIPFALATILFVSCNQNQSRRIYPILAAFLPWPHMRCAPLGLRCLPPGWLKACSTGNSRERRSDYGFDNSNSLLAGLHFLCRIGNNIRILFTNINGRITCFTT